MRMTIRSIDNKGRTHKTELLLKNSFVGIHQHGWQDEEQYLSLYQFHRKVRDMYYVKNEIYLSMNHAIGLIRGIADNAGSEQLIGWMENVKNKYPELFEDELNNGGKSDE